MVDRSLRVIGAGLALTLSLGTAAAFAAPTPERRARVATTYVVRNQSADGSIVSFSTIASTADAIVSLSAARRGPGAISRAVGYLRSNEADIDAVGEKAKVIMALVASERNPRSFEGRNLVKEIRDGVQIDGRYGDLSFSYVFDQALAILALDAADAAIPANALTWLVDAQCGDGGWQFDQPAALADDEHCFDPTAPPPGDFNTSDTNTTSMVIQAFAARADAPDLNVDPFPFFNTARDQIQKGWVFAPQFACSGDQEPPDCSLSDANSTALVIQAYVAGDRTIPNGGYRALRRLQYPLCGQNAGAFAVTWTTEGETFARSGPDLGATVAAILGILKTPLPVGPRKATKPAPKPGPC